jgi:hypothetical protein
MADDLIHCPSCGFQLRLPTELYGTAVECPQCHSRFTAPAPTVRPAAGRPTLGREYDAALPSRDELDYVPIQDGNPVAAPAIALLIVSLLGLLFDAYMMLGVQAVKSQPRDWEARIELELNKNRDLSAQQRQEFREILSADNVTFYGLTGCGTTLVGNLLTAAGAALMLARRGRGVAILGCIFALNPVNVPTCLLQVPFGIWGLIALLGEPGRRAFR